MTPALASSSVDDLSAKAVQALKAEEPTVRASVGGFLFSGFFAKLVGLVPWLFKLLGGLLASWLLRQTVGDILAVLNSFAALAPKSVQRVLGPAPMRAASAAYAVSPFGQGYSVARDGKVWAVFMTLDDAEDIAAIMEARGDR